MSCSFTSESCSEPPAVNSRCKPKDVYKNTVEHMNQNLSTFVQEVIQIAAENSSAYSSLVAEPCLGS